jgi:hypothetical protein
LSVMLCKHTQHSERRPQCWWQSQGLKLPHRGQPWGWAANTEEEVAADTGGHNRGPLMHNSNTIDSITAVQRAPYLGFVACGPARWVQLQGGGSNLCAGGQLCMDCSIAWAPDQHKKGGGWATASRWVRAANVEVVVPSSHSMQPWQDGFTPWSKAGRQAGVWRWPGREGLLVVLMQQQQGGAGVVAAHWRWQWQ